MVGILQPLSQNFQIVDSNGKPTIYFINWSQQRQQDISGAVSSDAVADMISTAFAGRKVIAGTNLSGGGPLSSDVTISHTASGVTAGTYGSATKVPKVTLDAQGHVTAVTEVTISGGGGGGEPWYFAPPLTTDFPTAIGTVALSTFTDDSDVGLIVGLPPGHTGVVARLKAITPGTSFVLTMRFNTSWMSGGTANAGFALSNGTQNWCYGCDSRFTGPSVHVFKYSTSGFDGYEVLRQMAVQPPWFQVSYNGVTDTAVFSYSIDGKSWVAWDTETSISSYLTGGISGVGPFITTESYGLTGIMSIDHFEVV